jgi:hypothetical protein
MNNFGPTIRGVAFRVVALRHVYADNRCKIWRSDRRDALGVQAYSTCWD